MHRVKGHFHLKNFITTDGKTNGAWVSRKGTLRVSSLPCEEQLTLTGYKESDSSELRFRNNIEIIVTLNGKKIGSKKKLANGEFTINCSRPKSKRPQKNKPTTIEIKLRGVQASYYLAVINDILTNVCSIELNRLKKHKDLPLSRKIIFKRLSLDGETIIDFGQLNKGFCPKFISRSSKLGFNLIGWYKGYLGIGESVRAFDRAASAARIPVDNINMRLHLNGGQSRTLWNEELVTSGNQKITLIHADAPQSFDLKKRHTKELSCSHYKIGYWAWELSEFPDGWIQYASVFDEIWCPSDFCQQAMSEKLPCPVITMPHSITLSHPSKQEINKLYSTYNLPRDKYFFLFLFDLNSFIERKNPFACIKAYLTASQKDGIFRKETGIIIKLHGGDKRPEHLNSLNQLKREIPHLYIIEDKLPRNELTALQTLSDCFVSLHRAEGFGLSIAECMYLGKPVISTNWSAPTEFLNSKNGCPVDYKLTEIKTNVGPYTADQKWAEPDIEHASEWMLKLFDDPQSGKTIGNQARIDIEKTLSPVVIGAKYRERLNKIALF